MNLKQDQSVSFSDLLQPHSAIQRQAGEELDLTSVWFSQTSTKGEKARTFRTNDYNV